MTKANDYEKEAEAFLKGLGLDGAVVKVQPGTVKALAQFAARISAKAKAEEREELRGIFRHKADFHYCAFAEHLRRDVCLGQEIKIATGKFTEENTKAFEAAYEHLGKHRAFADAAVICGTAKAAAEEASK